MKEFARTDRVSDFLQKELAHLIQFEIKDPRLGMVTVQDVRVSRDLGYADVYITVMPFGTQTDEAKTEANEVAVNVLNKAAGFLRTKVGKAFRARITPELRFFIDDTLENGMRISSLIEKAVREDKSRNSDED